MTAEDRIPFAVPDIGEEEIEAVSQTLRSGWLTTGPNSASFEKEFVEELGDPSLQAIAVNSATAGLHLALESLGIQPGDEVLVPDWTFTSTAEVVRYCGATPVMVDVLPESLNIDLEAAQRAVSERTKLVMPVHFAGLAVDREALADFARCNKLRVVEDAAHAHPTTNKGVRVGLGESDCIVYSFYATKTMTTGEGGMVVTRHSDLATRMRTMRLHGISRDVFDRYTSDKPSWQYEVVAPGFKYNLTDTAAAMGRVQLRRAGQMRDARASIAARYLEAFADLPVQLPVDADAAEGSSHSWHLFVLRLLDEAPISRNEFIEQMSARGILCSVHFIPLHLHPYWRDSGKLSPEQFPVAADAFTRAVSLPIFSTMTDQQVSRVISAVRELLG
ncbi:MULTISPECIES: DegT/DnrJ/EryC1/StrS family aminotransferase [unclassified Luteococcus]|uniref:DegT/DnrJ/EryC1/StrS family aminotransferase n=1 Tax=unclassified Luteococcus TaxID=2639923 RepID=UPI00313D6835